MIKRHVPAMLAGSLIAGLSACSSLPTEETAAPALQNEIAAIDAPDRWAFGAGFDQQIADDWADLIEDDQLQQLIEEALERNPSLRASAENLNRARAVVAQSKAGLLPTITGSLGASGGGDVDGDNFDDRYSSSLSASWEADLWGAIRSGILSDQYDLQSTAAIYKSTRQSLIANVARAYISLVEAKKQLQLSTETLAAQTETLRVVQTRYDLGAASRVEVVLAESDVAGAQDNVVAATALRTSNAISLQTLLNRYPDGNIEVSDAFPSIPENMGIGAQIELLSRRPDILAAEYDVLSAFSATRVLEARRWPELSLSAGVTAGASNPASLFDPASLSYSIGASLANSLFDGGLTKARLDAANATQRQALALYGQTVLSGYQEVEVFLQNLKALRQRQTYTETRAKAARETLDLAEIQYRAGDIDLLDVLTFRQRSFQADSALLRIQQQLLETRIALYLALGGSAE